MKLNKKHILDEFSDQDGYWIYLKKGFKFDVDPAGSQHVICEDTKQAARQHGVMKCECQHCKL